MNIILMKKLRNPVATGSRAPAMSGAAREIRTKIACIPAGMGFFRSMATPIPEQIRDVLAAYAVDPVLVRPIGAGLINRTCLVTDRNGTSYILQSVNRKFPPELNLDIDAATRHLEQSGLLTPRLLQNRRGMVFLQQDGQVWRLFNHIDGNVHESPDRPEMAGAAGAMLGRMHAALARFDHELKAPLPPAHDTMCHTLHLKNTLERKSGHARYARIKSLGESILANLEQVPALPAVDTRMVHGDPKISNFIFTADNREVKCMVDFDTLNRMPVYLEIGDALRSWCNPSGEDTVDGYFSMAHCRPALEGYAGHIGRLLTREEWLAVPAAVLTICLELAARFCADALNEDYFSWDPDRFGSHGEHSEIRAGGQFNMAKSVLEQYDELTREVRRTTRI